MEEIVFKEKLKNFRELLQASGNETSYFPLIGNYKNDSVRTISWAFRGKNRSYGGAQMYAKTSK